MNVHSCEIGQNRCGREMDKRIQSHIELERLVQESERETRHERRFGHRHWQVATE